MTNPVTICRLLTKLLQNVPSIGNFTIQIRNTNLKRSIYKESTKPRRGCRLYIARTHTKNHHTRFSPTSFQRKFKRYCYFFENWVKRCLPKEWWGRVGVVIGELIREQEGGVELMRGKWAASPPPAAQPSCVMNWMAKVSVERITHKKTVVGILSASERYMGERSYDGFLDRSTPFTWLLIGSSSSYVRPRVVTTHGHI